jgi:hypothetical protein
MLWIVPPGLDGRGYKKQDDNRSARIPAGAAHGSSAPMDEGTPFIGTLSFVAVSLLLTHILNIDHLPDV